MGKSAAKRNSWEGDGLYFIPLGGSEQFGVNLNVYINGGRMLAIDCGVGFADERFPGIDLLLPDPEFLEKQNDRLDGLIITHAHEDHVGAVAYLYDRLQCPIWCSPFTAAVLKEKLREAGHGRVAINVIKPYDNFTIGPFKIKTLPVAHSIPDTCALLIETKEGRVLHSGDWNLDPEPVTGYTTDAKAFQEAGKAGILAYVGDSTNAEVPGRAGSESEVEAGLAREFAACKGRIAVTAFSSNIGRIISIARAAQDCGRTVSVVGRSLHRMVEAARECGYLKGVPEFISDEDASYLSDHKVVMIVTGSQGEPRAALSKMSRGEHPKVRLKPKDTVIFSARAIPGNEKAIGAVINNLIAGGIHVVTPDDTENVIHVSGHPCRDEISDMLHWLRPQAVIPVHGEHTQLQAHADLARACQVPNVIVPKNGAVIKLGPGTAKLVDHVETGLLAVDPKRIIDADHASITTRRKLQYTGVAHITVVLNAKGEVRGAPQCHTVGLIDPEDDNDAQFEEGIVEEVLDLIDEMTAQERRDDAFVKEELRIGVRRYVFHNLGLKPATSIHLVRV